MDDRECLLRRWEEVGCDRAEAADLPIDALRDQVEQAEIREDLIRQLVDLLGPAERARAYGRMACELRRRLEANEGAWLLTEPADLARLREWVPDGVAS